MADTAAAVELSAVEQESSCDDATGSTQVQKILVPRYRVVCPRERCGFRELCGSLEEAVRLSSDHDAFHEEVPT